MKSYFVLLILTFASQLTHATQCRRQSVEEVTDDFEIISISEMNVKCVSKANLLVATEFGKEKVDGCVVDLRSPSSSDVYTIRMTGKDCLKENVGKKQKLTLVTTKNVCCAVRAEYGPAAPKCGDLTTLDSSDKRSEIRKTCLAGIGWWVK